MVQPGYKLGARTKGLVVAVSFMTMLLLATLLSALTPPPDLTSTDLFTPGMPDTAGVTYACYRIPSMVWVANEASPHAVLLAFAEGRRGSCADKGDVRIVARRSSDGGQTWSSIEQVATAISGTNAAAATATATAQ
uniref:Sialidase domain-containing protein n=1 Tax=Emiliania huxleyi TaxID=2903 RepID=A0A7S3TTP3_EMIHU